MEKEITPIPKSVYKVRYRTENGLKIFIVDGKKVRENYHMDFIAGGHHYRYDFIPEDEIWIDDAVNIDEIEPVVLHEITERGLMKEKGMGYNEAHDIANKREFEVRKERNEIRDKINAILYTPTPEQTEPELLTIITTINKVAHFGFLKDRVEIEGRELIKSNYESVMKIEIPFKGTNDESVLKTLVESFAKLNELEMKDKFFKVRIQPMKY